VPSEEGARGTLTKKISTEVDTLPYQTFDWIYRPASVFRADPSVSFIRAFMLSGHKGLSVAARKRQPFPSQPIRRLRLLVIDQHNVLLNDINLKPIDIISIPKI